MTGITLTAIKETDLHFVKQVYDWYVLHSTATFHTGPVTIAELHEFIYIGHPRFGSWLILHQQEPVGYCYLTNYKKRQAYDKTAELTIYLRHDCYAKGIGQAALEQLEAYARVSGFKNLLAIISGDNDRSIHFFEKNGYFKCAHFKNVGEKFGKVLDVVGYQKEI
ncbi:GNAT family N-acetyltransferase [Niabella drilacis]|uniref:Phosphinothricin acetyltransferase n=1 Tax=Niabella drilacis (strain DSM 25811 / CCM 8410 / CCUG 62505 / LMG 26954 / E90) TaxID=1285928 RepID=A0A1G6MVD6_NIADE|nr:GNAT family N-acetyltransferase [Niabella drilacis]SDC59482.1 phosphinothricin acetyltransferase [Niabella drilacis]